MYEKLCPSYRGSPMFWNLMINIQRWADHEHAHPTKRHPAGSTASTAGGPRGRHAATRKPCSSDGAARSSPPSTRRHYGACSRLPCRLATGLAAPSHSSQPCRPLAAGTRRCGAIVINGEKSILPYVSPRKISPLYRESPVLWHLQLVSGIHSCNGHAEAVGNQITS